MTLFLLVVFVYGLFLGSSFASFACVAAERVPAGVSLNGRSRCGCGRQLKWSENVPLIGWLKVRGVARCCGARIPARYVIAELVAGLATAVAGVGIACAVIYGPSGFVLLGTAVVLVAPVAVAAALWDRPGNQQNA
jgi:prepilin signal peptidase PulO-like enzyme (type II secretory pathway)